MRTCYSVGEKWFATLAEAKENAGTEKVVSHNLRNEKRIAEVVDMINKVDNAEGVRGYKVFNPDWTCSGFQYEVGKTYEMKNKPNLCNVGFHFCKKVSNCFNFYDFNPNNKVAEVIALGDIDDSDIKACTNKIKIIREISWHEVLDIVNSGSNNTGLNNSGDCNSGNSNTGDCNSGHRNSGYYNSGYSNTGDCNSGSRNSGNCNSGSRNSGDWNKTNHSSGCFNTEESTIKLFNKESNWTYKDWFFSSARALICRINMNIDTSECAQIWWNRLDDDEKEIIKAIPNFDAEIFKEIVGVDVNA